MDDRDVLARIAELVREEDELHARGAEHRLDEDERRRISELEVALDQCWDLLRQQRARQSAGLDPDQARPRDPDTVENYLS